MITTWLILASLFSLGGPASFQELMDPTVFPNAQSGMRVVSVEEVNGYQNITTTGARMSFVPDAGLVEFAQRIGKERPLAGLSFGGPISGPRTTHYGPGFVRIELQRPQAVIRINGDSLCMIQAKEPMRLAIVRHFDALWTASYGVHHVLADEWGGFGIYCSEEAQYDCYDPMNEAIAAYQLQPNGVMWLSVFPAKPYDWKRSLADRWVLCDVAHKTGYPVDDVLRSWPSLGNLAILGSEATLWKDRAAGFEPSFGTQEFGRMRDTLHQAGMKLVVSVSPGAFQNCLKKAHPPEEDGGWPACSGQNIDGFEEALSALWSQQHPDGLCLSATYASNPAAQYALARRTRALVGDAGLLVLRFDRALGPFGCSVPCADAYSDAVFRSPNASVSEPEALRYLESGYNLHNCVSVVRPGDLSEGSVMKFLNANCRLAALSEWAGDEKALQGFKSTYEARLTESLQPMVEKETEGRQAAGAETLRTIQLERAIRGINPDWKTPVLSQELLDLPPEAQRYPAGGQGLFAIVDGALKITTPSKAVAFLSYPVKGTVRCLVVKVRRGSDQGIGTGPGAMLLWPSGASVRIGLRQDDKVQANICGIRITGQGLPAGQWIWLRVRWGSRAGAVETSPDGSQFSWFGDFLHRGELNKEPVRLLVGKTQAIETPNGPSGGESEGVCDIDSVNLY